MYKRLHRLAAERQLVLASKSPRRVELLQELAIPFAQIVPDIEELMTPGERPFLYAERLAVAKAVAVKSRTTNGAVVLGCDTVVVFNEHVLEKPADTKSAVEILSFLSGRTHMVCSAAALYSTGDIMVSGYELTRVRFNRVSSNQIEEYVATGEPMDKAGAYGIQGKGAFLVDSIEGNLDTVIGLPRTLLDAMAGQLLPETED